MSRFRSGFAIAVICAGCAGSKPADVNVLLREADRLAWMTNWTAATPVFARAEQIAGDAGDARNALYARFGRLRGEMQLRPLPDLSSEIARDLDGPLARSDRWLRLRGLTAKADIDLEWDVQSAHDTWQQVLELATELQHEGWVNRAKGDLGMIAFLRGNSGEASAMVGQALQTAVRSGDVGGQLRYLSAIGTGLLMAGDPRASLGYIEKALALAQSHPDAGFPYPANSTKILALLALKQPEQANGLVQLALKHAASENSRIKEIELLMMAGTIARAGGQEDVSLSQIERAVQLAKKGGVQRLLGEAEAERANIYRRRGNLDQSLSSARAAVQATKAAGSRWTLPKQLEVQASTFAALGKIAEAEQTYEEAADVLEGTMLNVPSASAQARLVGVMSEVYTGHFKLAAGQRDAPRAFAILERARGRALADVLRGSNQNKSSVNPQHQRAISQLQVRLLRVETAQERRSILDALWQVEQDAWPTTVSIRSALPVDSQVELATVQAQLGPTETLLEYVITEPNSYCLILTRTDIDIVILPPADAINGAVEAFIADIRKGALSESRRALYEMVIRPVVRDADAGRFIVVPDGQLHRVPFDVLVERSGLSSPQTVATTAPSATVFSLLRSGASAGEPRRRPTRMLLAVGGVPYNALGTAASSTRTTPNGRGFYDAERPPTLSVIPASRTEVLSAARLLRADSIVLTGADANESLLKAQKPGDFGVLHFAVHAFADPEFPARAALVVLGDSASGDDGLLQPREIINWRLNASLVVLSACDTAVGPTIGQEGVQNLARAFLAAGARSVITTLWAVNDRVSLELMRAFYTNVAAGENVATALAGAKHEVSQRLGPPALPTTAAFQLVGDGDAIIATPAVRAVTLDDRERASAKTASTQ